MENNKKFKLIKDYPGCIFKIGDHLNINFSTTRIHPENYPEFWEEIIEYKCGQLCYRIWKNGEKSLGKFAIYEHNQPCFISNSESTHFYALENYEKEGKVNKNEIYGLGDYKYEIVEKDYEILSFKWNYGNFNPIYTLKDGLYCYDWNNSSTNKYKESELINHNQYDIYSVKRLSDGEIFTIGDKYENNTHPQMNFGIRIIENFTINKSNIILINTTATKLNDATLVKTPLFTTEDGVDIFEGDKYYAVNKSNCKLSSHHFNASVSTYYSKGLIRFSSKEKAEEYITLNKLLLSINDIEILIAQCRQKGINFKSCEKEIEFRHELKELVKTKLKL